MRSVIVSSFAPNPDGKIGRRNPVYRTGPAPCEFNDLAVICYPIATIATAVLFT